MLVRLQVSGFKNLVDVDVRFGPFTCIAGPNGVGKSNLFDAILFLSALTELTLAEAAHKVRGDSARAGDVRGIFLRAGDLPPPEPIKFVADLILPPKGVDELGQPVEASITLVRYKLALRLRSRFSQHRDAGPLELVEESLVPLRLGAVPEHLPFPHSVEWRKSVLSGRHTAKFLSTEGEASDRRVRLHQDGRSGRLFTRAAASLPRTLLSTVQAGEYPTAMLVRREMQSWRLLQLEGSALRRSDGFDSPAILSPEGAHMASALFRLANRNQRPGKEAESVRRQAEVFANVSNRLAELIDDVRSISVERDETRQLLTVKVVTRDGTSHSAASLSDGTLRFLALAVTEYDRTSGGLLCFEEPENGIHPRRVSAMLRLLQDIAVDPDFGVDEENPLRQVIVNTHSPSVVMQSPEDSLLTAEPSDLMLAGGGGSTGKPLRIRKLRFGCLENTWRSPLEGSTTTGMGNLLAYLNPTAAERDSRYEDRVRVMDRQDAQSVLPLPAGG